MVTAGQHWGAEGVRAIDTQERAAKEEDRRRRAQELARRVRALRAWRDLTLDELSLRAGLSRQYLGDVEKGARPRPRAETLERLAEALGVTVPQLRGCEPLTAPELPEEGQEGTQEAHGEKGAPEPSPRPAMGLTSLLTLPPGATVLQETKPDGSVVLYIHIPGGPAETNGGRNPPATTEG